MPDNYESPPRADGRGGDNGGQQPKAAEVAQQAQQSAQQAVGQAQDKLREQLNQRSSQAATQISQQALDLRSVSQALREQGKDGPAQAAERLAGYAERAGGYLRDKDSDALLADAEEFGRQRPWVAAAGGLALGFAASRFLKASSRQRYQTRSVGSTPDPGAVPAVPAVPAITPADAALDPPRPAPAVSPGSAAVV